ncbi:hypothetical protein C8R45DRAFT_817461, partial [Mycena sanguinolenta]
LNNLQDHIAKNAFHNSGVPTRQKCHPNTREQILRDLHAWVDEEAYNSPVYFLTSPAGSGKTTIAMTFADSLAHQNKDELNKQGRLLGSFFFSAQAKDVKLFVPTVAYSIGQSIPGTKVIIQETIDNDPAIFDLEIMVQLDRLVLEPLAMVTKSLGQDFCSKPHVLVVDGVDECEDSDMILQALFHLAAKAPLCIAIFISCRPHIKIFHRIQSSSFKKVNLAEKYQAEEDIEKFLREKFGDIKEHHRVRHISFPPDWPEHTIIQEIIKMSSGHFIFASVVVEYVNSSGGDPQKRLKHILSSKLQLDSRKRTLEPLDHLYNCILSSIPEDYKEIASKILGVQVAVEEADTLTYFESYSSLNMPVLLSSNCNNFKYAVGCLENILLVTKASTTAASIHFLHATLPEFLKSSRFVNMPASHSLLAIWFFGTMMNGQWSTNYLMYLFSFYQNQALGTLKLFWPCASIFHWQSQQES